MKANFYILIFVLINVTTINVQAQLEVSAFNTAATENFNTFQGSGFTSTPAAGQLDSDTWVATGLSDGDGTFGGTHSSGDFARGTDNGTVTTGGVYAFEVASGNYSLGIQPGGSDFTPGDFILKIKNTTGEEISKIDISYSIYIYNDQNYSNSFNFSYSPDNTSYTEVTSLNYTSVEAEDDPANWEQINRSYQITGISIPNNGEFYLKWTGGDVSGSGFRDQFALDDVSVTAPKATPKPVPVSFWSIFAVIMAVSVSFAGLILKTT